MTNCLFPTAKFDWMLHFVSMLKKYFKSHISAYPKSVHLTPSLNNILSYVQSADYSIIHLPLIYSVNTRQSSITPPLRLLEVDKLEPTRSKTTTYS